MEDGVAGDLHRAQSGRVQSWFQHRSSNMPLFYYATMPYHGIAPAKILILGFQTFVVKTWVSNT